MYKSQDVKILQDAGGVDNMGGNKNGGVGGKKGYIHSSSGDVLVQGSTYRLLCNSRTGSLLVYQAMQERLRESDIREREICDRDISKWDTRESDIQERAIGETVATCRFAV